MIDKVFVSGDALASYKDLIQIKIKRKGVTILAC